jgi:hypothetical protein
MHVNVNTPRPHLGRNKFVSPTSSLRPTSILSRGELRRIVAEMLG